MAAGEKKFSFVRQYNAKVQKWRKRAKAIRGEVIVLGYGLNFMVTAFVKVKDKALILKDKMEASWKVGKRKRSVAVIGIMDGVSIACGNPNRVGFEGWTATSLAKIEDEGYDVAENLCVQSLAEGGRISLDTSLSQMANIVNVVATIPPTGSRSCLVVT